VNFKRNAQVASVLLALHGLTWAATTGSISGTVKDPSGAVIAGAQITATNTATNVPAKTVSDDKGVYTFPSLPVGRYDIKAEEEGAIGPFPDCADGNRICR
jgi:hypothetical protein